MKIHVMEYWQETLTRYAEREAVVDGDRVMTFRELDTASWRLAAHIMAQESGYNQPIAVFLPKGLEAIVSFLAILKSGNFYIPLDTSSPIDRVEKIIGNLNPAWIITAKNDEATLDEIDLAGAGIIPYTIDVDASLDIQEISASRRKCLIDTDPVYLKYTSGSTGTPKGVVLPHRAILDYIDWAREEFNIDENSIIGNQAPFYFDISVQDIYLCFATGAKLVIISEALFIFPVKLLEYVAVQRISFICWVPSIIVTIANMGLLEKVSISHLEIICVLGEVMPTKHFNIWMNNFPHAVFYNTYGPTEAAIASTYYKVDRQFADTDPLPIGKPCRNTSILLLDNQDEQVLDANSLGEICIRGSSLALGYWDAQDKTEAVFIRNPVRQQYPETVYRTGDLGYWNERGELMFSGRKDYQVKHLGYRIELGEIEQSASSIETIESCCVLYNEARQEITLFYTAEREVDLAQIRKRLQQLLPKYMIPKTYYRLESIPLNANGKADRSRLKMDYFTT